MTEVRCKGEIWKFFDKGFWSAFTKTLSNLGEYFSDSLSRGDKSPCLKLVRILLLYIVSENKHTSGPP